MEFLIPNLVLISLDKNINTKRLIKLVKEAIITFIKELIYKADNQSQLKVNIIFIYKIVIDTKLITDAASLDALKQTIA